MEKLFQKLIFLFVFFLLLSQSYAQSFLSQTLEYDGETREYDIYIPAIYDGTSEVPLIFSFHGGGGNIAGNVAINDLRPLADAENFIAVYPQALSDPNDDGNPLWIHKDPTEVDDVLFIDALIDAIAIDYQIDQERIYACGYSHGGEFTLSLACRLNNRIAAIGVVARTMQTFTFNNCVTEHPTGVMTILGTDDGISNYDGVWWLGTQFYVSAIEMHEFWATRNECGLEASVVNVPNINTFDGTTVERLTWSTEEGCDYVEELKVLGGGHDWPGTFGNMDINATEEIWQFVSRYDLNGLINCETTSIEDNVASQVSYVAYPNPFDNQLIIENSFAGIKDFKIYSSIGELVLSGKVDADLYSIDLSLLSENIYILEIENKMVKLVKTK